jgi:hypothetical protein
METTNGKVYTLPLICLTDGELKFRQNEDWAVNWGNSIFPQSCGIQDGLNIPAVEGEYAVYFNRVSGNYNFISLTTDIIESMSSDLSIFPKPSADIVYFRNNNKTGGQYNIIDMNGKTIQRGNIVDQSIDVSALSSGVFVLQIQTHDSQFKVFKIIKE